MKEKFFLIESCDEKRSLESMQKLYFGTLESCEKWFCNKCVDYGAYEELENWFVKYEKVRYKRKQFFEDAINQKFTHINVTELIINKEL